MHRTDRPKGTLSQSGVLKPILETLINVDSLGSKITDEGIATCLEYGEKTKKEGGNGSAQTPESSVT